MEFTLKEIMKSGKGRGITEEFSCSCLRYGDIFIVSIPSITGICLLCEVRKNVIGFYHVQT